MKAGLVVVLVASVARLAGAQTGTGTIEGRVADGAGAPVADAVVTARSATLGVERSGHTHRDGTYSLALVIPGEYRVVVEATGFEPEVRDVIVAVGATTRCDAGMRFLHPELIALERLGPRPTFDVGQVIPRDLIQNLPLNRRRFQDFALLIPGVVPGNVYDPTKLEFGSVSSGGASGRWLSVAVDGSDDSDGVAGGLLQQVGADAVQEFKVTTQRPGADVSRATSTVLDVVTASGGTGLRGSAFLLARNAALSSRTYFEEAAGSAKPDSSQLQGGAAVGGPIGAGRYFLSYEGHRRNRFATVETFGALPAEDGRQIETPFRAHLATAKLDRPGERTHWSLRYSLDHERQGNAYVGGTTLESAGADVTSSVHAASLGGASQFGVGRVNLVRLSFQHASYDVAARFPDLAQIRTPSFTSGPSPDAPQQILQRRFQLRDDYTFQKGGHELRIGVEAAATHFGGTSIPRYYGSFVFAGTIPGSDSADDYLLARADTYDGSSGSYVADDDWTYLGAYVQDDWRIGRRLTLSLGLRYEIQGGPYASDHHSVARAALVAAGHAADRSPDANNLGPRLALRYDVGGDGRWLVRGGYGLYHAEIPQAVTLPEAWSDPATPLDFVSFTPAPFTPLQYASNRDTIRAAMLDPSFSGQAARLTAPDLVQPQVHQASLGLSVERWKRVAFDLDGIWTGGRDEIARWDIDSFENASTRLSPPGKFAPRYSQIVVEGNRGRSNSYALCAAVRMRASHVTGLAGYTLSTSKNSADDVFTRPGALSNLGWEGDYAPSPNDVRHRVTAGLSWQLPYSLRVSSTLQAQSGKPYSASAGLAGRRSGLRELDPETGAPFPRNSFRGPGYLSWDARVSKTFSFGPRSLELLFEVFNLTDYANLSGDPALGFVDTFASPSFGQASRIVPDSQRQAQLGARFNF